MGTEVGIKLPNIYFSDYPCIPELWARSEVHQLYTWRQGQAALGTMVRDSRHWQLCWNMFSDGSIDPRSTQTTFFLQTNLFWQLQHPWGQNECPVPGKSLWSKGIFSINISTTTVLPTSLKVISFNVVLLCCKKKKNYQWKIHRF